MTYNIEYMDFKNRQSLAFEHNELHQLLVKATKEGSKVGKAAKASQMFFINILKRKQNMGCLHLDYCQLWLKEKSLKK